MDKISVIIPVYKTENFLDACMESILTQDWPDFEVILVDDGSPDGSPAICDRYAAEHENVRVIHQKNQGSAAARNAGLYAAAGDWIAFVDSDDCLDGSEALRILAERAIEAHADITVGSFRRMWVCTSETDSRSVQGTVSDAGGKQWQATRTNHHHLRGGSYTDTVDFRFKGFYMYGHLAYNWGKLYRKEFLLENALWIPTFPFTQDKAHNLACCACEPVYAFVEESVYLYRENEESVTGRYKKNLMPVWIAIAEDFQKFLQDRHIVKSYGDLVAFHFFFGAFFLVKQELSGEKPGENVKGSKGGVRASAKVLRKYGKNPAVHQSFAELARGKYLDEIDSLSWKFVIRGASILFFLHGYALMALGIAGLTFLGTDKKITQRRYREANRQLEKKAEAGKSQQLSEEECRLLDYLRDALRGQAGPETENMEDAGAVIRIAQKHAVLPLLYDFFGRQAQSAARSTVLQSYRLLFMTKYVVGLLEEHQIPVVVLKGVSAAADYPVPELRKSGDVDLLLTGKRSGGSGHIPAHTELEAIMKEAGFIISDEQHANHHIAYTGPDGIHVELHEQMAEPFVYAGINEGMEHCMQRLPEHCIRREIMGVSLPVLDRPYQAYQLLLHMLQHFVYAGFGLKLLCDWVVLFRETWTDGERELLRSMIQESHLERFAGIVTGVCVEYLGLEKENAGFLLQAGELELFLRELFDSEEFGAAEQNRMVMMKGARFTDYMREFHHQMHLNYPQKGKNPLLWPALWVLTLARFVRNNRRLRHVSTLSVLKKAGERSRRMEKLHIFE